MNTGEELQQNGGGTMHYMSSMFVCERRSVAVYVRGDNTMESRCAPTGICAPGAEKSRRWKLDGVGNLKQTEQCDQYGTDSLRISEYQGCDFINSDPASDGWSLAYARATAWM